MGLFDLLVGGGPPKQGSAPQLVSMLPDPYIQVIQSGKLAQLNVSNIRLKNGEVCYFTDEAAWAKDKKIKETHRSNNMVSVRLTNNITIHSGGANYTPNEYTILEYYKGFLYLTNERIIFSSLQESFEYPLNRLTTANPYTDAIMLQFGNDTKIIMLPDKVPDSTILKQIIDMI